MRFIVIAIGSVVLFFPAYWLFEPVVGPNWGAGIAAIAMYIAFPILAMKVWPGKQTIAPTMLAAPEDGSIASADSDVDDVIETSSTEVADWLRQHVKKKPPGRIARWLGEPPEFTYEVGRPYSVQVKCIRRQTLFGIYGEAGLLPYPLLPGGSRGLFAIHDQELYLLEPSIESLSALLAREGASLDDAEPEDLAKLICLILLNGRDARQHDLVQSADQLRCYQWGAHAEYRVDEPALQSVANAIVAPSLKGSATRGWRLEFVTVEGWMHQKDHLGVERYEISPAFNVTRLTRVVLHERIFSETPHVVY